MKRLKLLGMIALLIGMMAAVIIYASPYAPVAGGPVEIEALWEIEDAREESDVPLVTALNNHGVPLAYDRNENTFYCTLGLENGEEWPELRLTAPDAKGVSICFSDDYTYDYCADAIAEGYAYELMAYNDTHYSYFYVVFTGLPIVTIGAEQEIGQLDVFSAVTIRDEKAAADAPALVHTRGAGSAAVSDKKSYRVKFVRDAASGSVFADVPVMGAVDDLLLISCAMDETLMRDKLSWSLYASLRDKSKSFGARPCEFAELFVSGEYMGVYLMMEPVDAAQEMAKSDPGSVLTDSLYRTTTMQYAGERPVLAMEKSPAFGYELFYGQAAFAPLEPLLKLERIQEDEAFVQAALACIDLESILTQYLFIQAGGMSDNVNNNMYIWAHHTADGMKYQFAPWDMELTWGRYKNPETGEAEHGLFGFDVAQRLIDLDAGGITRDMLEKIWRKMRADAFTAENVERLTQEFAHQLNASGAFARDAARWEKEEMQVDAMKIANFAAEHFFLLDELFSGENTDDQQ